MTSSATTPTQYLKELPSERKSDVTALHKLIRKTAPALKPYMLSGMLAYGTQHYTYASGREGDWGIIMLASQKNYISLYICATENGHYVAELYKKRLPKASIGKSCVRFKKLSDVDTNVLVELIAHGARTGF